ncbi:metal-dependent hydrolase [Desulforamulus aquiferis]|uniref:UPF0173 metal-dependent hydrolase P6N53_02765 n=1 Tax=Desulforamulus aquiferis TaxID=1397668 RepID=A0AAW7Z9Z8_9FIRM|nr:metal-dependent hydrolase [Desulforamulus aquiferis]MDO7786142.1 metal-dependent hydrolase [Desulforamulus aquiferis]
MRLTFLGHAAFLLESKDIAIVIDPFLTGNPVAPEGLDIKADFILVSHGHGDHFGDVLRLAKESDATVISVYEVANYCARQGVKTHAMHIGGSHDFGKFKVKLTQALHGSSTGGVDGPAEYLGNPCGFLIFIEGKTLYYSGDTGLFGDMNLIGKLNPIDVALLPIGDNFTMGPDDALEAVKLLNPRQVVPMHYNTWPLIVQDPEAFKGAVENQTGAKVLVLKPGEYKDI